MAARLGKPVSNIERSNSDGTVRLSLERPSGLIWTALSAVNHLGGRRTRLSLAAVHDCCPRAHPVTNRVTKLLELLRMTAHTYRYII